MEQTDLPILSDSQVWLKLTDTQVFLTLLISWFMFWYWVESFVKSFKYPFADKFVENDFVNRCVSALHGTMIFCMAVYDLWAYKEDYRGENKNNEFEKYALLFSGAYFLYDTVVMRIYKVSEIAIESHHIATIGLYAGIIWTNHAARVLMVGLMVAEVSNLVMHVRKLLTYVGLKHTKLRNFFQIAYFATYTLFRGIGGPYVLYLYAISNNMFLSFGPFVLFLFIQSVYTFPIMAKAFYTERKVSYRLKKEFKVKKFWFSHNPKLDDHLNLLNDPNDERVF